MTTGTPAPWSCLRCGFGVYGNPLVIRRDVRQCCRCGTFDAGAAGVLKEDTQEAQQ